MPELRQSPITGEWVVIAAERAMRPHDFSRETKPKEHYAADCPFCPGNEGRTPPEVYAVRPGGSRPDTPGWRLRVVPNKYPAFNSEPPALKEKTFYNFMPARGRHEVIIHGPDHHKALASMEPDEIAEVFSVYQARLREISREPGLSSALIIVNHGQEAGASLEHPHSQLFAMPLVAPLLAAELAQAAAYADRNDRCVVCDVLAHERAHGRRVVDENQEFLAFCPHASRSPFELYIASKAHGLDFTAETADRINSLAELFKLVLARLHDRLGDPPYNLYLHTRPFRSVQQYHWHLVLIPKTSVVAGFEFGTGIMINIVDPEAAAEFLG